MAMELWDPYNQMMSLREAMDRLLQDTFVRPSVGWQSAERNRLALDVREEENDYKVEASLPGVKPEDVQIQVTGDTVTIRGDMREEREQKQGGNVLLHERRAGSYTRTFTLPMPIDADHAAAHFEHGVLTLTLPKAEQARPRRIQVQSARTDQQRENVPIDTSAQAQQGSPPQEGAPIH